MDFYIVKSEYIDYLRKFENKVFENKNNKRPYIGIVFTKNKFNYFIPLSSPKLNKKLNSEFTTKIYSGYKNKNHIGNIMFNNMIPVADEYFIKISLEEYKASDFKYYNLLINQQRFISKNENIILNKAIRVYKTYGVKDISLKLCCNFKLLETKCIEWKKEINKNLKRLER